MRDEPCVFEKEGVQYSPDITYIKDGKIALMVIKIDACSPLFVEKRF